MRKLLLCVLALVIVPLAACSTAQVQSVSGNVTESYQASSTAVKEFARISAADWLFGSGIIQGSLPPEALPAWVSDELKKVDAWFEQKHELTEWELGYIVGLRLRLAGPIIKVAIEQYAPGILGFAQVGAVLGFIGL